MHKKLIASLVGISFTQPILAVENLNLNDIVVTAARVQQSRTSVLADVTVIDRETIERAGAGSLTDVLRAQPGVQIVSNGGAGTTSSLYLRGTNADHIIVLVDGLRINSATLGTTAFENIPLSQIEKIEILRGPASSLYGADAIGGVIQIFTRKGENSKPLAHAAVGLGSYDTQSAEAGISGSYKDLKYGINLSSFDTNSFSAIKNNTLTYSKDNDGYRNVSASGYLELAIKEGHSIGLQFFESRGRNHSDGTSPTTDWDFYTNQTQQSYAFTSKNQLTEFWHSTLKLGMGVDDYDYHAKPSVDKSGISSYRTELQQLTWQNDFSLPLGILTLACDHLEQSVDSNSVSLNKSRNNDGFLASYLLDHDKHSLQASLREDHNTQFGNHTTGGIGYGYRITHEWRVTANYGQAFKAPTFNQLYYPGFGDPNLKPETSENIEASARYSNNKLSASITAFENKIDNLITFSGPATTGCTLPGRCPVNVGKVDIQGVTTEGSWNITDTLLLNGNLTVQSPRDEQSHKLLARRGNRYSAVGLLHNWGDLQWGAEVTGASARYDDAANQFKMSGYALINLIANYRITPEWKLEARANNVLDKDYVLSTTKTKSSPNGLDYNTAGSNLFIGLRYQMKP